MAYKHDPARSGVIFILFPLMLYFLLSFSSPDLQHERQILSTPLLLAPKLLFL
nr:MAG TPA: hypothetical protein [Caudoviricetes sp.]